MRLSDVIGAAVFLGLVYLVGRITGGLAGWWCAARRFLPWHEWRDWREGGRVVDDYGNWVGTWQDRTCRKCGLRQERRTYGD